MKPEINGNRAHFFNNKHYHEQSVFLPENLLREARRQKNIDQTKIPVVCILDPDGDIVKYLKKQKLLKINKTWACYHTELYNFKINNIEFGIIGCAVGSAFAVLVAEQLFVTGCSLIISISSAGKICDDKDSRFVLIKRALRDEGTSYHYLPSSDYAFMNKSILKILTSSPVIKKHSIKIGDSWTTDAPFRETKSSIAFAKERGVMAVEMEAAALYALAQYKNQKVVCIAHLTNTMAQTEKDFEKGVDNGSGAGMELIHDISLSVMNNTKYHKGSQYE